MDKEQRNALLAAVIALKAKGPTAGRPLIGTLGNPKHPNMKELRYDAHNNSQIWRAAFAFDPERKAIILVASDKQGIDEEQFYADLLKKANKRFDAHLKVLKKAPATANSKAKTKTAQSEKSKRSKQDRSNR